jgi:hypothetical protein
MTTKLSAVDNKAVREAANKADALLGGQKKSEFRRIPKQVYLAMPRYILGKMIKYVSAMGGPGYLSTLTISKMKTAEMALYLFRAGSHLVMVNIFVAYYFAFMVFLIDPTPNSINKVARDILISITVWGIIIAMVKRTFAKSDKIPKESKSLIADENRKVLKKVKGRQPYKMNTRNKLVFGVSAAVVFGGPIVLFKVIMCNELKRLGVEKCGDCKSIQVKIDDLEADLVAGKRGKQLEKDLKLLGLVHEVYRCPRFALWKSGPSPKQAQGKKASACAAFKEVADLDVKECLGMSCKDLKKMYYANLKEYHPDKPNGDLKKTKQLTVAYEDAGCK